MGSALLYIFDAVIGIAIFLIIVTAIISWLVAFNVINMRNMTVYRIVSALDAVVDPLYRPFRRFIPPIGGLDLTPIVVLILLQALKILVHNTIAGPLVSALG